MEAHWAYQTSTHSRRILFRLCFCIWRLKRTNVWMWQTPNYGDRRALGKNDNLGQALTDGGRRNSNAFVHAKQQLQTQSDASVPPEGQDADEAGHDGWPEQVLHRWGAVRVSIKHLRKQRRARAAVSVSHFHRGHERHRPCVGAEPWHCNEPTLLFPVWSL